MFVKEKERYQSYSKYLKEKYGEKIYKLPINLPISCPNRIDGNGGCSFCAECATGFEAMDQQIPVRTQLEETKALIAKKYHAKKYIAYFQNYTNTFMPLEIFENYILEAANFPDIVEISISTRPDCIRDDYLSFLEKIKEQFQISITIELGLQIANDHLLKELNRGHSLAEYIDAAMRIKQYGFTLCTHIILNLPGSDRIDVVETAKIITILQCDIVKIHSLYIAKNTRLCTAYENGTIEVCSKEEYFARISLFLEHLSPGMIIERMFSRIPEKDAVFCNWQTSWWKLKDELEQWMTDHDVYQGKKFNYTNGAALRKLSGSFE